MTFLSAGVVDVICIDTLSTVDHLLFRHRVFRFADFLHGCSVVADERFVVRRARYRIGQRRVHRKYVALEVLKCAVVHAREIVIARRPVRVFKRQADAVCYCARRQIHHPV